MRVTELQQACEMNGLDYEGLNRKGLISALQKHAERGEETVNETNGQPDVEPEGDEEVSFRRTVDQTGNSESVDGASAVHGTRQGMETEPESFSLLELKLALAWEETERIRAEQAREESSWLIQKQKMELGLETNPDIAQSSVRGDIARLFPSMKEGEPLIFFLAFERTPTLNEVPKNTGRSSWAAR